MKGPKRLSGILMWGAIFFITFTLLTGWVARQEIVNTQREGCERVKLDRIDNAGGWRAAQRAREAAWRREHEREDLHAARDYAARASRLEARSKINCEKAFEDADLISIP